MVVAQFSLSVIARRTPQLCIAVATAAGCSRVVIVKN